VGGELPLHGAAALELVAGGDHPEAHGIGVAAADPPVDDVVLVVQRVLVLVIHLSLELWLDGVCQQDGLLVGQWGSSRRISVCCAGHVPLYVVGNRHVVEPNHKLKTRSISLVISLVMKKIP
jgi:hypothetical protein